MKVQNEGSEICMELSHGVFFQQYGELVYLRHTGQRQDYIFNSTAGDFLMFVRENPGCSLENLIQHLSEQYEIENYDEFLIQMQCFEMQLVEAGILNTAEEEQVCEDLREQIRTVAREIGQLFSVTLELTYRCNEKCIHCYVDDKIDSSKELTLEEYRALLDQLHEMGCMNLLLTGGEVTMRTDFMDIVEYAVKKGFCIDIYTNGLTLSYSQISKLAEFGVNSVSFSLYGPDAKSHDSITGIPGSFECTFQNMLICKCAGLDTFAKTVVMKQNYERLDELMELGKLVDISINTSMIVTNSHNGKPAEMFRLMDAEKYCHVTELSLKYDAVENQKVSAEGHDLGLCGTGMITVSIDPYGNVMPCNAIHESIGNIRENSLEDIRKNSSLLQELQCLKFESVCPKGGKCSEAHWCSMCLGSAYSENKTWTPTPDICLMAQGIHKANQNFLNYKFKL